MIRAKIYMAVIISMLLLGGGAEVLARGTQAARESNAAAATGAGSASSPEPGLEQRHPRYAIQLQDVLLLSFPISPELNQTVTVQPDGYINLQGAGSLHVRGLTAPELAEAVKRAYIGILHEPIVNVDLVDFQKPFFTVAGQVSKPGQYELRASITAAEAIAIAGGLAPTAKTQLFFFHRTSGDVFEVRKLNLKDVLNGKHPNEEPMMSPGDMIFVPEKFITNFRKYVPYTLNASTYLLPGQF